MPVGKCKCGQCTIQTKHVGGIFGKHLQCHCSKCRKWCEKSMTPDKQHSKNALDWWWNVKVEGPVESECSAGTLPCCGGMAVPYGGFERRMNCSVTQHGSLSRPRRPSLSFTSSPSPPPLLAQKCGDALVGWGHGALMGFAAVNAEILIRDGTKTEPYANTWYASTCALELHTSQSDRSAFHGVLGTTRESRARRGTRSRMDRHGTETGPRSFCSRARCAARPRRTRARSAAAPGFRTTTKRACSEPRQRYGQEEEDHLSPPCRAPPRFAWIKYVCVSEVCCSFSRVCVLASGVVYLDTPFTT